MSRVTGVENTGADSSLIEERRGQIVRAAVKLFSENGYYNTTTQQISREAGMSAGLIYHYFQDKDDILFMALRQVLDTYEREIPAAVEGVENPVERLCTAIYAYCRIIHEQREATVLPYRSTKSLRAERRGVIKAGETRTNLLMESYVAACIDGGFMNPLNAHVLVYVMVSFAHAWALKYWALGERYTLRQYVEEGLTLFIEPHLTQSGHLAFERFKVRLNTFDIAPEVDIEMEKPRKQASSSTVKKARKRPSRVVDA